ncbi:MAG TPA: hypothetical protein DCR93_23405 [Cytophagales bacterium]|nr:hypothetical protein [Cytophagales bacterium]
MKLQHTLLTLGLLGLATGCALDEPEIIAVDSAFPYRLEFDVDEFGDLPGAEDFKIEIKFADWLDELPTNPITLTYSLNGSDDFTAVAVDEVIYEYEEDDCKFEREGEFSATTITIPVDPDLGTVPEKFEVVVAFNLTGDEATDGGFELEITEVSSMDEVLFNDANSFEYAILDNAAGGAWEYEMADEAAFNAFQVAFGTISTDIAALTYAEVTGTVKVEFDYKEVKFEIELVEEETTTECEDGEVEEDTDNVVIEIEAEYDLDDEDLEIEFEGKWLNEDGEEFDFIIEAEYVSGDGTLQLIFGKIIDSDNFADGEELFDGELNWTLAED